MRETCMLGVFATCLAMSPSVAAQQSWVIVPGLGGTGGTWDDRCPGSHLLRPPVKVQMVQTSGGNPGDVKTVSFRTATLLFNKIGDTYVLSIISVRAPSSSITSDQIGIDAPIQDVRRVYGDFYSYRAVTGERPKGAPDCMQSQVKSGWVYGKPDWVYLSVDYVDRGISFEFWPLARGNPSNPKVESITVERSRQCLPVS